MIAAELQKLEKARSFPYAAEVGLLVGQSYMAMENWEDAATSFEQMLRQHRGHELADDAAALQAESLYRMKKYDLL